MKKVVSSFLVICFIITSFNFVYATETETSETSSQISSESTISEEPSSETSTETSQSTESSQSSSEQSSQSSTSQGVEVIEGSTATSSTTSQSSSSSSTSSSEQTTQTTPSPEIVGGNDPSIFVGSGPRVSGNFSPQTKAIVEAHKYDFNATNFYERMAEFGGYENYLKNHLGGVFAKWAGRNANVKSASELQEISEYCYGLMTIYGFDYCNGQPSRYKKWGAKYGVTSDAFYPKGTKNATGKVPSPNEIDVICAGKTKGGLNMTTCCNWCVDMVYRKAGLFGPGKPNSSCSYKSLIKNWGAKIVTREEDLRVGDIIECFDQPITDYSNPDSWKGWGHACFVGEVNKSAGNFTIYEGGSFFTGSCNYKHVVSYSRGISWKGWVGIRLFDLTQDYMTYSEVVKEGDSFYYYDGRNKMSGWQEYLGNKYYFDPETLEARIGWNEIDGVKYYFNEEGILAVGLTLIEDQYYLFDENGKMCDGWQEIEGIKYYFKDGIFANGSFMVDGVPYIFKDGQVNYGFTIIDGMPYMVIKEGESFTGWQESPLMKCYFIDNVAVNGWQEIDGVKYYFKNYSLASGLTVVDEDTYYFCNGIFQTGYLIINEKGYFFGDNGTAIKNNVYENIKYNEAGYAEDFVKYCLFLKAKEIQPDNNCIVINDNYNNKSMVLIYDGVWQIKDYVDTPPDINVNYMERYSVISM